MSQADNRFNNFGGSVAQECIISPESLSVEQTRCVTQLLKEVLPMSARTGVLVGVLRGKESWDLRPLLLGTTGGKGSLHLVRQSGPDGLQRERQDEFRQLQRTLMPFKERAAIVAQGEYQGQFWTRRRFFQKTLADLVREDRREGSLVLEQLAHRIIYMLRFFHKNALVHGHICLENVGLDELQPVFVDFGFRALSPHSDFASLAPEILHGASPSVGSDLYGLGLVLQGLLGTSMGPEQQSMVSSMLASDPAQRPTLDEVESCLFPAPAGASNQVTAASVQSTGRGLRAGKLLTPGRTPERVEAASTLPLEKASRAATRSPQQSQSKVSSWFSSRPWLVVLLATVSCLAVLSYYGVLSLGGSVEERQSSYRLRWESGEPELMREVANAALEDDEVATALVVQDAMRGAQRGKVRSRLIKTAFNPRWVQELSAGDKRLALTLGLAPLGVDSVRLPSLSDAHPGVILAVISDLNLGLSQGQFDSIPLSRLAALPAPYGVAFAELEKQGVKSVGSEAARSLSHILTRDITAEIVERYLGPDSSDEIFLSRLLIILPIVKLYPETADFVLPLLSQRGDILARRSQWFSSPSVANWTNVPHADKVFLIAGLPPELALSFEQYADLLKFPAVTVKRFAAQQLAPLVPSRRLGNTLSFLAEEQNDLSRDQVISLLFALKLEGPDAHSLIAKWFETQPNPQTILKLLISRKDLVAQSSSPGDPFNVEAARYLSRTDWVASTEELQELSFHEEMMARALAYSRLSVLEVAQARILEEAVKREPNAKLRADLRRKIGR